MVDRWLLPVELQELPQLRQEEVLPQVLGPVLLLQVEVDPVERTPLRVRPRYN